MEKVHLLIQIVNACAAEGLLVLLPCMPFCSLSADFLHVGGVPSHGEMCLPCGTLQMCQGECRDEAEYLPERLAFSMNTSG